MIYNAWRCGIYDKKDMLKDGLSVLLGEVKVSNTDIENGQEVIRRICRIFSNRLMKNKKCLGTLPA